MLTEVLLTGDFQVEKGNNQILWSDPFWWLHQLRLLRISQSFRVFSCYFEKNLKLFCENDAELSDVKKSNYVNCVYVVSFFNIVRIPQYVVLWSLFLIVYWWRGIAKKANVFSFFFIFWNDHHDFRCNMFAHSLILCPM